MVYWMLSGLLRRAGRSEQQPVRALRLAAATDAVFQMVGTPLPLATGVLVERGRAQAMQAVDAATQAAARAEGQAMTLEQAVAYALEEAPPEIGTVEFLSVAFLYRCLLSRNRTRKVSGSWEFA